MKTGDIGMVRQGSDDLGKRADGKCRGLNVQGDDVDYLCVCQVLKDGE